MKRKFYPDRLFSIPRIPANLRKIVATSCPLRSVWWRKIKGSVGCALTRPILRNHFEFCANLGEQAVIACEIGLPGEGPQFHEISWVSREALSAS
jgi:hypothetical protein